MQKTEKSAIQVYLRKLVVATVVLSILSILGHMWFPNVVHSFWYIELLIIAVISYLVFAYINKFSKSKPQTLMAKYQSVKMLKLLIFLTFLAIYVFVIKTDAFQFLICFMVYYIVFTVIETFSLQAWLKDLSKTQ